MLQSPHHPLSPLLDTLQQLLIFLEVGSPELDRVLQMRPLCVDKGILISNINYSSRNIHFADTALSKAFFNVQVCSLGIHVCLK